MIPNPLHPAIVHFPIVFAVILPIAAIVAVWLMRRRWSRPLWALPVLLAAGLAVSSFFAVRTGEAQEDRVEDVVGDRAMHGHEEAGERLLLFSAILAGVSLFGLARGPVGVAGRYLTTAGALGIALAGYQTGRTGGELVYEHGAAAVYADAAAERTALATDADALERVDDDEEEDDD